MSGKEYDRFEVISPCIIILPILLLSEFLILKSSVIWILLVVVFPLSVTSCKVPDVIGNVILHLNQHHIH